VILDADGQHDPRDIRRLADAQRDSGAEIVVGSRFADGAETDAPIYRRFGLAVINGLTNAGLHLGYGIPKITDTQSGFRMYDSDAIETMSGNADLSDGMDVSIDVLFVAAEAGHRIIEVPINITYDVEESSTHHPLVQGGTLLLNILSRLYSDRPARLLNIPAAIFVFLGVALTVLTLTGSSLVAAVPLLAIALLLLCGGILSTTAIFLNRV
jgi:glycosyltransferase involved in cell wall biosynthesis